MPNDYEHQNQVALFQWARNNATLRKYPELRLLEGSMNGVKLTRAQAVKAKLAGLLTGAHDIRLPVRKGNYIGLSIELKHGDNKPSEKQIEYGEILEHYGHCVRYCWGWDAAREAIEEYLSISDL